MDIIHAPNGILFTPSEPVKPSDATIRQLIVHMKQALIDSKIGVGLAAAQVGVSIRLFLIAPHLADKKNKSNDHIRVFINPEIVSQAPAPLPVRKSKKTVLEGCLSLPDIWGPVRRSNQLTIRFLDKQGNKHEETFTGFPARIIQHEMDHLNGILFTQRTLEQKGRLYRQEDEKMKPIDI